MVIPTQEWGLLLQNTLWETIQYYGKYSKTN